MKNLLILGGEGFIGRNCLEYFHKKGEYNITSTYFSKIKNEKINKLLFKQQQQQQDLKMWLIVHLYMLQIMQ